jgi:2-aminoadipate transaminase
MDTRIEILHRRAARRSGMLSLAGGLPLSSLFPLDRLLRGHEGMTRAAQEQALQYGWPEGSPALRSWVADHVRARGADVSADDVIITTGAQQALSIVIDALRLEGAKVGVDDETYPGALELFRRKNAVLTSSSAAHAHYVVTGASNPRGLGLSAAHRERLLASPSVIIEDEAYAELRFDGRRERPLLATAPERTFHVGTLSKTLCPGLRIGWLIPPARYRQKLLEAKRESDLEAPHLTQALAEALLAKFDWAAHLVKARRIYARRVDRLATAVSRHLPDFSFVVPEGGFTLFAVCNDERLEEVALLDLSTRLGTSFDPGSMFRHDGARAPFAMRLSPCNIRESELEEAVRRLAAAITSQRQQRDRGASPTLP